MDKSVKKSISTFDEGIGGVEGVQGEMQACPVLDSVTSPLDSPDSPCSLDGLLSNPESYESYKRFTKKIMKKMQEQAERPMTPSEDCPSNESEVYSVFKNYNKELERLINFENFTDKWGQQLNFVDLFMVRFKQCCKEKGNVPDKTIREFGEALEDVIRSSQPKQRRPAVTDFDALFN